MFHATNVDLNIGDYLIPSPRIGNIKIDFYNETKEHITRIIDHILSILSMRVCDINKIISLAKDYNASVIEKYFEGLKNLNDSIIEKLPKNFSSDTKVLN